MLYALSSSFISKFYLGQAHVPDLKVLQDGLLGPIQVGVVLGVVHPVKSICLWIRSVNCSNRFKRCLKETLIQEVTVLEVMVKVLLTSFSLMNKGFYWSVIFPIQWPPLTLCSSCLKGGLFTSV